MRLTFLVLLALSLGEVKGQGVHAPTQAINIPVPSPTPKPVGDWRAVSSAAPSPVVEGHGTPTRDEFGSLTDAPTEFLGEGTLDPTFFRNETAESPVAAPTFHVHEPTTNNDRSQAPSEAPFAAPTKDEEDHKPSGFSVRNTPWPSPQTQSPYVANDDDPLQPLDTEPDVNEGTWAWKDSELEDMEHDRTVMIALLSVFGVGILLSICVAHQMMENPNGCCASICRIFVSCTCFFTRCIFFPCRWVCGCTRSERRTHDMMLSQDLDYSHDLELS